jgi:PAS domain S-box-containing protein
MTSQPEHELLKILLVDDDVDFASSMGAILDLEGHQVEVAHSVDKAVDKARDFIPGVALIDIKIGSESGLDLVGRLHELYPDLTCVMVTAYADIDTAIEALKSGVYDYLRKPFDTNELFSVLNRCSDRNRLLAEKAAADKARSESDARFRVAFETSPDAIILARSSGEIIDVNNSFVQLTGYRHDQVIGRNSLEVGLWKDPVARNQMLQLIEKYGQANNVEAEFRLHDGQIRTGLLSARVVEHEGEMICLYVVRDVHDLKEKERAIWESEERFRGLVSNIPGAVYRLQADSDWTMQYISTPIRDISGYSPKDLIQNKTCSFISIIHEEDRDDVVRAMTDAVSHRQPFSLQYRIHHSDGTVRWVQDKGRPVIKAGDSVGFIDGVVLDVTETMKTRQDLAFSKSRLSEVSREYSAVLEGIPDAILLINSDLKVVWGNSGASQHFNIPLEDLRGMACEKVWDCRSANCQNCIRRVFSTGEPSETIQKSPDGRVWGVKVFPVKQDGEELTSVIQIASDMTEKARLRDQASRAAHLAALGELAAGIAHEINNPTGMILLDLPMLKDALNDLLPILDKHEVLLSDEKIGGLSIDRFRQEVPLVIDEIYEGAERIKRIVDELKDFSRPATGELTVVDLNEVVKKAVSLVRNPVQSAADYFVIRYASKPLLFSGNAQRIEQVMVNLLLNACYAMQNRTGGISVETFMSEENDIVRVVVRDDGVGVEESVLRQITDPFFTSRRDEGGTGLGLSVSSRIIDEHSGTLSFKSEPGEGMVVTVELPAVVRKKQDA